MLERFAYASLLAFTTTLAACSSETSHDTLPTNDPPGPSIVHARALCAGASVLRVDVGTFGDTCSAIIDMDVQDSAVTDPLTHSCVLELQTPCAAGTSVGLEIVSENENGVTTVFVDVPIAN